MMQFSYGYFAFFHADPEHPDWAPLWNLVTMKRVKSGEIRDHLPADTPVVTPEERAEELRRRVRACQRRRRW